ncbi:MAG: DUF2177 family protein [Burkholderiales bacterium]|nr:DUF2177 family protein [Burkholderiales bacterium]
MPWPPRQPRGPGADTGPRWVAAVAATVCSFLALDALWLSTMSARLYRPALGPLLAAAPDWIAAAAFYPLYLAGVVVFAVAPALRGGRRRDAAARGAFLGLVAYATYDLTNQATLRDWPWAVTLADLAWGMCATAIAAAVGATAARRRA